MHGGPLRPVEVATAAVMAGLAVALVVIGWFLPHLGVIAALAVVPLGVVAHRHRFRALMASAVAACVVSFLVAGTGTFSNVVLCAVIGGVVGIGRRRAWPFYRVLACLALVAPLLAGVSLGFLALFSSLRKLSIEQVRNTWKGLSRFIAAVPGTGGLIHAVDRFLATALRDWWATIGIIVVVAVVWFGLTAWVLLGAVLDRLRSVQVTDRLDVVAGAGTPSPLPVCLRDVRFRYPGAALDALDGVTLDVRSGEVVALVGDNGSGKSTLARVIAGLPPTAGTVERPGSTGLGRPGGTAMIMQHPETQILGVRVADDVVWGLKDAAGVEVAALLQSVGLAGMEDRDTSTLSGGELQRLAVAAALARSPALLISDESTAMVDAEGRERLVSLLASLPPAKGMSVLHVTHRREELASADRYYRLEEGRIVPDGVPSGSPVVRPAAAAAAFGAGGRLDVTGVSHTYMAGTPWAQPALHDVTLGIGQGEGVLVLGGNGSGKSTLAWVMAGVLRPSRGRCLLDGEPVDDNVGSVGLAFQHARLQLQRQKVAADVQAAGASDDEAVAAALAAVGLDADTTSRRRVDELSGGQQRRVALAGILARRPSVLVLDEPMAGLDAPSRDGLLGVLAELRATGLTIVVISHDVEGMERVCDRVVRLEAGRVVSDSPSVPC